MSNKAERDKVRLKELKAIIRKSIEWKAKLDAAEREKIIKEIDAAFESIDETIVSTGRVINDMIKVLRKRGGGKCLLIR
jgi:hypothetical protein